MAYLPLEPLFLVFHLQPHISSLTLQMITLLFGTHHVFKQFLDQDPVLDNPQILSLTSQAQPSQLAHLLTKILEDTSQAVTCISMKFVLDQVASLCSFIQLH